MKANDDEESSIEIENVCLNIDRYLDELERSLEEDKNTDPSSKSDLTLKNQNFNKSNSGFLERLTSNAISSLTNKHSPLSDTSENRSQPSENLTEKSLLSSQNSRSAMIRATSMLEPGLEKSSVGQSTMTIAGRTTASHGLTQTLHYNSGSQLNLAYSHYNSSSYGSNYTGQTQQIGLEQVDDDENQLDSVQFTTPFEFTAGKAKKFARQLSKRHGLLPIIELRWRNLTYYAKRKNSKTTSIDKRNSKDLGTDSRRVILDRQNGEIHGGELTAIIGPSGAGKSTLLECLAGRRTLNLAGSIVVNYSSDYLDTDERVKIAFIAQRDNVIGVLTVKEILTFASKLKNHHRIKNAYYHPRLVNSILKELGLEKCANLPADSISGGQLKRLSFAMELISGPDILLLDEPTSGLDSSSAASTIQLLRKLTDLRQLSRGTAYKPPAIICSIHQPSARVLHIFHKIYVLSNDGRCVYHGNPSSLLAHLARFGLHCPKFHNPADFIVEIASGDYGVQPINILAKNHKPASSESSDESGVISTGHSSTSPVGIKHEKYAEELNQIRTISPISLSSDNSDYDPHARLSSVKVTKVLYKMKQQNFPVFSHFFLLLKRTYLTTSRDPKLTWFRILQALFIGTVMAFLYDYPIGKDDGCILDNAILNSNFTNTDDLDASSLNSRTQDNIAFIFFITLFTVMASMMPTVLTFPAEVSVLIQERNNGWYSCWSYYWTKIIADTPYQLVVTITFCSIVYPATGQPWIWWRFLLFNYISVLVAMIAQSVGILFGTIYVRSVETAVFMAPLSMAPVFLLSGFFAKVSKLPIFLKPIAIVSYVRYAFEGFLVAMYGFNRCEDVPILLDNSLNGGNSALAGKAGQPVSGVEYSESKRNQKIATKVSSRASKLFKQVPKYAAEFPKVWPGFYNPMAYAQMMEQQNMFSSTISSVTLDPSTPAPTSMDDYPDVYSSQTPVDPSFTNSTGSASSMLENYPTGSFVLNHFELKDENLYENLIILMGILFALRVAGYLLLIHKTNEKR